MPGAGWTIERLKTGLEARRLPVVSVRQVPSSLEDVFIDLVNRRTTTSTGAGKP